MSVSKRFEEIDQMYKAIKDIDLIQQQTINGPNDSRLDQVYMVIQGIDRSGFDKNIEDRIIVEIKNLICELYNKKFNEINEDLNRPRVYHGTIDDIEREDSFDTIIS